jgi:stage V sporulation protein G
MEGSQIQVERIYKIAGATKVKAFVDVLIGGIVVKGLRLIEGSKGLFLSMPREQGKDGRWYNTVYPKSKQAQQELTATVLSAYSAQE